MKREAKSVLDISNNNIKLGVHTMHAEYASCPSSSLKCTRLLEEGVDLLSRARFSAMIMDRSCSGLITTVAGEHKLSKTTMRTAQHQLIA